MTQGNEKDRALVPFGQHLPTALRQEKAGSVLHRMVDGALEIARRRSHSERTRHLVGGYELCEPDYRQVFLWADRLGMTIDDVLVKLDIHDLEFSDYEGFTTIVDGHFQTLALHYDELPLESFDWFYGLKITVIDLFGKTPNWPQYDTLPSLKALYAAQISDFQYIDLSAIRGLTYLECSCNNLNEIDISSLPNLLYLHCGGNKYCGTNNIQELNLSSVPNLKSLDCSGNNLTKLDLSSVPGLTELQCQGNPLTELDLRWTPELKDLSVDDHVRLIR